jgi:uncharacterized protein
MTSDSHNHVDPLAAQLDQSQVAEYLKANPEFFLQHPDVLSGLSIPHPSGRAISLLEHQVNIMRERNTVMQQKLDAFVINAHSNDALFEKTRMMILELLKASIPELPGVLARSFQQQFATDECRLLAIGHQLDGQLSLAVLEQDPAYEALGQLFVKMRAYCGELTVTQRELLFPDSQHSILSAALVPLNPGAGKTLLLALGSRNSQHFNPGQDTLFLDFVGEVISALLSRQQD